MAGSDEEVKCKRSMDCKCPECLAASAAFSIDDLKAFSSTISYDDSASPNWPPPEAVSRPAPVKPKASLPSGLGNSKGKQGPNISTFTEVTVTSAPVSQQVQEDNATTFQVSAEKAFGGAVESERPVGGNDDGGGIGDSESKAPIDPATIDESSLRDRLLDKNWKSRKEAYDQLVALFGAATGPDEPVFSAFESVLVKILDDNNASALDAALEAAMVFADKGPVTAELTQALAPVIISRGFNGRPTTIKRANDLLLKLMEAESPEAAVMALLDGIGDKRPKVPPACFNCIEEASRAFGAVHLPLKALRLQLKPMFDSSNKNVREGAMKLMLELIKWVGQDIFQDTIKDLRTVQKAELEAQVKNITPGQCTPTVGLRKLKGAAGKNPENARSGGGGGGTRLGTGDAGVGGLDPYDLIDPVDLLALLPKTEFSTKIAEQKWSEKVAGLEIAIKLIGNVPKLVSGDYAELVRTLKGLVNDSHFQVQSQSIKLLTLIGMGLREKFNPFAPSLFSLLVSKTKEKKLLKPIEEALNAFYGRSLSFESIMEDIEASLDVKRTPVTHSRKAVLEWIIKSIPKAKDMPTNKSELSAGVRQQLAKAGLKAAEDPDAKVRETAIMMLSALVTTSAEVGSDKDHRSLMAVIEEVNKPATSKLYKRIHDGASGQQSGGGQSGAKSESPTATSTMNSTSSLNTTLKNTMVGGASGSRPASKGGGGVRPGIAGKGPASKGPTKKIGGEKPLAKRSSSIEDDSLKSDEDFTVVEGEAMAKLAELGLPGWENEIVPKLSSAKWLDRKDAIAALRGIIQSQQVQAFPYLIMFLIEQTKNFKDSNVNIIKEALETATAAGSLINNPSRMERGAAFALVSVAVERLGDRKLRDASFNLLLVIAEIVGPAPVFNKIKKLLNTIKNPQVHIEVVSWLATCVNDFGASRLPLSSLVDFTKSLMDNTNPKIRAGAINLLGALYKQTGPPLKGLVLTDDIKPAIKAAIESEFENVGYDPSSAVGSRKCKGESDTGVGPVGGGVIPRIDLATALDKDILMKMGNQDGKTAWKERKAAVEQVQEVCEKSGYFIEANKFCAEILKALKARLGDSQSNLKPLAASAIAAVIISLEDSVACRYSKLISEALLATVQDNKKLMRDASLTAVEKILSLNNPNGNPAIFDALLPHLATAVTHPNGRTELLNLLNKFLPCYTGDANILTGPLLDALQDKAASARTAAEQCLIPLVRSGAIKPIALTNGMRDFAPAVKRSLQTPLQRIMDAASAAVTLNTTTLNATTSLSDTNSLPAEIHPSADLLQTRVLPPTPTAAKSNIGLPNNTIHDPSAANNFSFMDTVITNHGQGMANGTMSLSQSGDTFLSETSQVTSAFSTTAANESEPVGGGKKPKKAPAPEGPVVVAVKEEGVSIASNTRRMDMKSKRAEDSKRLKWPVPPEEPRQEEAEHLRATWATIVEGEQLERLFPSTHRPGVTDGSTCIGGLEAIEVIAESGGQDGGVGLLEVLDLVFKWIALHLCDKENVQVLQKLLDVLVLILEKLRNCGYSLQDYEASVLIPYVLEKSGQAKDRFRRLFRRVMCLICYVYPCSKYMPFVLAALSSTKNSRTRVACLDELRRCIEMHGVSILGKKGLHQIARYVDARETEVRAAALDSLQSSYEKLGRDLPKLVKLLGDGLSDKAKTLIEERCLRAQGKRPTQGSIPGLGKLEGTSRLDASDSMAPSGPGVEEHMEDSFSSGRRRGSFELTLGPVQGGNVKPKKGDGALGATLGDTESGPFHFRDDDVVYESPQSTPKASKPMTYSTPATTDMNEDEGRNIEIEKEVKEPMLKKFLGEVDSMLRESGSDGEGYQKGKEALKALIDAEGDGSIFFNLFRHEEVAMKNADIVLSRLRKSFDKAMGGNYRSRTDIRLLSCALATLVTIFRTSVVQGMSSQEISHVLMVCFESIVDFPQSEGDSELPNMMKAMNKLCLTILERVQGEVVISALLEVMTLYRVHDKSSEGKLAIKALQRVTKHQLERSELDLKKLLTVFHGFFRHYKPLEPWPKDQYFSAVFALFERLHAKYGRRFRIFITMSNVEDQSLLYNLMNRCEEAELDGSASLAPRIDTSNKDTGLLNSTQDTGMLLSTMKDTTMFNTTKEMGMLLTGTVTAMPVRTTPRGSLTETSSRTTPRGSFTDTSSRDGKLVEVVELLPKTLDINSGMENMKRLYTVLKNHPDVKDMEEHLKLYQLSGATLTIILDNFERFEADESELEGDNMRSITTTLRSLSSTDLSGKKPGSPMLKGTSGTIQDRIKHLRASLYSTNKPQQEGMQPSFSRTRANSTEGKGEKEHIATIRERLGGVGGPFRGGLTTATVGGWTSPQEAEPGSGSNPDDAKSREEERPTGHGQTVMDIRSRIEKVRKGLP